MDGHKGLTVEKPVKLVFAGGFLGSGKTTALAGLAKRLIRRGMRVGIVTNDQSENLVDTVIARRMLTELGVPVEEVVEGCFCCKFDDLIIQMEKILAHHPDVLMGEPVGSCTDFVAAVANPIKIRYRDAFRFAPFSTMVDPARMRELLLGETRTSFPEEVSYLFQKQLEEADVIVLNKIDLLGGDERDRLVCALEERFTEKSVKAVSAREGEGMDDWLEHLLSAAPGANTVLKQIDYDRYATAEAVLGWLNAAVKVSADESFDVNAFALALTESLAEAFRERDAEIGHLKLVITAGGKALWANVTHLGEEPAVSGDPLGERRQVSLVLNARVKIDPDELDAVVRDSIAGVCRRSGLRFDIVNLQCFSPAYPNPPHIIREGV
ncbi:MAG: hypothetical protein HY788_07820 [Deltaproteobacteria bacterium]|nr:hypothetical protein [Deltaproteobacteria bacterium]